MPSTHRRRLPVVYMRGGSSKAVFYDEADIPAPGPGRDRLLKRLMGSPDANQIDGMGGSKPVTSKIAIIKRSERADADVDYTFAQCGIADDSITYGANCGNISAGVGPFAIEQGMVPEFRGGLSIDPAYRTQEVRIYNTNTDKIMVAHIPINGNGEPVEKGDFAIAGVPGTGAPILLDYKATLGASQNKGILPTGNAVDTINLSGRNVRVTICDAANLIIFAHARDLGITGQEASVDLTANGTAISLTRELRGKVAVLLGMCDDWTQVDRQSPFVPATCAVAEASPERSSTAAPPAAAAASPKPHLSGRFFFDNTCHPSMAGSVAVCTAAASRVPDSIVYDLIGAAAREEDTLRIAHPLGMIPVVVKTAKTDPVEAGGTGLLPGLPKFEALSFVRTARRILDGSLCVPEGFDENI